MQSVMSTNCPFLILSIMLGLIGSGEMSMSYEDVPCGLGERLDERRRLRLLEAIGRESVPSPSFGLRLDRELLLSRRLGGLCGRVGTGSVGTGSVGMCVKLPPTGHSSSLESREGRSWC